MAPKYAKCLQIANQIGDRRVERVLEALFCREKEACEADEMAYDERIEEVKVRMSIDMGLSWN